MLKLDGDNRFETKCTGCMRTSPAVVGTVEEATAALKRLNWVLAMDARWHCPICTMRTTTKQRRSEP